MPWTWKLCSILPRTLGAGAKWNTVQMYINIINITTSYWGKVERSGANWSVPLCPIHFAPTMWNFSRHASLSRGPIFVSHGIMYKWSLKSPFINIAFKIIQHKHGDLADIIFQSIIGLNVSKNRFFCKRHEYLSYWHGSSDKRCIIPAVFLVHNLR